MIGPRDPSHWATVQPDRPAIITSRGEQSFRELSQRVNQLARALDRRGLQAGDALALMCGNRVEFVETVMAASALGLRLTPVNKHLTVDEAHYIFADCDATVAVVDAELGEQARAATDVDRLRIRLLVGDDPGDGGGHARQAGRNAGFESYEQVVRAERTDDLDAAGRGTLMLYTSGTTGRPKGVIRADGADTTEKRTAGAASVASYTGHDERHLCTGPLYHGAPLSFSLLVPLRLGVSVVLMERWDAEEALSLIERYRVTHTHMVPTMFHRLLSLPGEVRSRHDMSSLAAVYHGAAACPIGLKQAMIDWWGPVLYEYYSATEGFGTMVDSHEWLRRPGTVGRATSTDHVRVLDDDGTRLPAGAVGSIYLKSPERGGFRYHGDDTKTDAAYNDGYFTLGDLGYLDDDDYLFVVDRRTSLIVSGGVNIYPAEIEAVLLEHPLVNDVAVIGVPNEEWGEEVKAVVTTGHRAADNVRTALHEHCHEHLAPFKWPRSIDVVDQLPRDDNGKLYKHRLREQYRRAAPIPTAD